MSNSCKAVTPSQDSLSFWQETGLKLIARFGQGRDVVLAIDLTESVGFGGDKEGTLRLDQIIKDSLRSGDHVYIAPFASVVNPSDSDANPIIPGNAWLYRGKPDDTAQIQAALPQPEQYKRYENTDIQNAELFIYRELAQLNYCRLQNNTAIRPQSVVWITDAPIHTAIGATWIETPLESPFRDPETNESLQRFQWLEGLPLSVRQRGILSSKGEPYQFTIVDIEPTVQEFCTPAPGGQETCLVTSYIIGQLWLPTLLLLSGLGITLFFIRRWLSWQKKWQLRVEYESDNRWDDKTCYLGNGQQILIGDDGPNSINCPGQDVRGYLHRQGNRIYLTPNLSQTEELEILYRNEIVTKQLRLNSPNILLNLPSGKKKREFEVKLTITK